MPGDFTAARFGNDRGALATMPVNDLEFDAMVAPAEAKRTGLRRGRFCKFLHFQARHNAMKRINSIPAIELFRFISFHATPGVARAGEP